MAQANKMPYNLEAEQSVLGCVLIDQVVQSDILNSLKVEDFLVESHKIIFEAMREVYVSNVPVDFVTLTDLMQKNATLEKAGGINYISDLTRVVPSSANFNQYVDIVKRDSNLRKLITGSNVIIKEATQSSDDKQTLQLAEKIIFDISENNDRHGLESLSGYLQPVIDKFELLEKDKDYFLGIKTGFYKLDYITNGLHKGNLIILAARPSIGKTTLAMNIAEHVAIQQKGIVAVFALEMTKAELAQRMLCSVGNVKMDDALKGKLSQTDPDSYKRLWEAQKTLDQAKIFVDESTEVTPQDILSKCRRMKIKEGGLDLIIVDHIQLMQSAIRSDNRQQEVTEISRGLKMIAKELEVPVIALSQLSRQVTSRKGGKPVLSDLRESGAIEQDADLVMFIHRPDKDADPEDVKKAKPNGAELIIAKNRNGTCGEVDLIFKGEYVKYVSATNFSGEPPREFGKKVERDQPYVEEYDGYEPLDDIDSLQAPDEDDDDSIFD